jgi:hypothetical protein
VLVSDGNWLIYDGHLRARQSPWAGRFCVTRGQEPDGLIDVLVGTVWMLSHNEVAQSIMPPEKYCVNIGWVA